MSSTVDYHHFAWMADYWISYYRDLVAFGDYSRDARRRRSEDDMIVPPSSPGAAVGVVSSAVAVHVASRR
jgi:hypothetical protein